MHRVITVSTKTSFQENKKGVTCRERGARGIKYYKYVRAFHKHVDSVIAPTARRGRQKFITTVFIHINLYL